MYIYVSDRLYPRFFQAIGSAFLESLPYTTTIVAILATLRSSGELGIPTEPLAWVLSVGACVGVYIFLYICSNLSSYIHI